MSDLSRCVSCPRARFELTARSLYVLCGLAFLVLCAMLLFAWYRNELADHAFDLQSPVVQTCVTHRITQKVTVVSP